MTREEAQKYANGMTYRDAVFNLLKAKSIPYRKATFIKIHELLKEIKQIKPDTVNRGVLEQVMWERDIAIAQLKELGYGLGEKIDHSENAINRQAVLDALDKHKYSNEFCEEHHIDWSINLGMAHLVINDLPPVTPQEKETGYWIDVFGGCECSKCGCLEAGYSNYCPNCGQPKMLEVENK